MHVERVEQSKLPNQPRRFPVKENRQRLFRKSRPFVRPFEKSDLGWLWAAYKAGSFPKLPNEMDQATFANEVLQRLVGESYLVDDDNGKFRSGRGPVAFVVATSDGWRYEPAVIFFKWATKRNMLRALVAFLHKTALSSKVGVCLVRWEKSPLLDHMKKYGVLYYRGRIPMGLPSGYEYIYSITGRKGSEAMRTGA